MKSKLYRAFFSLLFFFFFIGELALAQPGDPGEDPFEIPIDGGLLYLIAAGISFGIYRLRKKKS